MNRRRLSRSRRAVSEVIGALLLILIVVIAVASLAYFLSTVQTQSQNRQLYLDDVADEKLQISNLQFSLNNSLIQYEIYNLSNNTKYYVQMINDTAVDLINETSGMLYHSANLNSSNPNPLLPFIPAFYNSINSSATANIYTEAGMAVAPLWNITFEPSNTGAWAFRTATWSNATITVRNLNIQTSGIKAVEVNGNFLNNNVTLLNSNNQQPQPYNLTVLPIEIPEKQSVNIVLHLTYLNIPRTSPMQIVLASSAGNFFTTSYAPPSAVIQESVSSENYLITSRDVPMFSGSGSAGSNGSFIQEYIWQIDVPESAVQPGWTWTNVGSIDTVFAYGQSFQYRPEAFFTSPELLGSTSTVLVDSSAVFTSAQVGQYLTYTSGPATGVVQKISDYTANTLTTAAFNPAPDDSGDTYAVVTLSPAGISSTTTSASPTTLTDMSQTFGSAQLGEYLTYTDGPAAGETRVITAYTTNTLTTSAFNPAPTSTGGDTYTVSAPTLVTSGTTNTLGITGPFRVTLTTVDQYGFTTTSQSTVFTNDPDISPAGSIAFSSGGTCSSGTPETVTVSDIFGRPLSNAPVQFLGTDGVGIVPDYTFAITSSTGQATTCYSGSGYLEAVTGSLTPAFYPVSS